jgi:enoyl-CoA hydratase/carnithine racemase
MRFAAPAHQLQSMIFRGLTFTPDSALQHGLVDEVVDADRLWTRPSPVAESLAALPSAAFALTKRQLRAPALQRMRRGAESTPAVEDAWASPERSCAAIRRLRGADAARTVGERLRCKPG